MTTATTVRERPILFSGPMISAIRDGRKTQTRRIVKPQPEAPRCIYTMPNSDTTLTPKTTIARSVGNRDLRTIVGWDWKMTRLGSTVALYEDRGLFETFCPYGQPGDHLWVKETCCFVEPNGNPLPAGGRLVDRSCDGHPTEVWYRADVELGLAHRSWGRGDDGLRWTPSIHMPRWASRILLEIESVRVERLQSISEADAVAEGCEADDISKVGATAFTARGRFRLLWESINGPDSWEDSPWVWAITFRVLEGLGS